MKNQRSKGFIFSLVIVVAAVLFVLPTAFRTQAAYTNGYLTYMVENGEATITDCDSSISGGFTIPSKLGGYPVTGIGWRAFYGCTGLTSITIPNSVTSIGFRAFEDCAGLTSITIPNRVTSIESSVFEDCTGLRSVTIPYSIMSIGNYAFYGCIGLTSVTIPNRVTSIGDSAFKGCTGLTNITIPNSVTSIGASAFERCTGLTSITIPDSVTSIGSGAFDYTAWYNSQADGNVYLGKFYYTYKGEMPNGTKVAIKSGTKGIVDYAFRSCTGLTSVTIPNSIKSICNGAFRDCTGLTSVTIPYGINRICGSAFYDCTGLRKITIPDSVSSIGWGAFSGTAWYESQPDGNVYIGKFYYKYKGKMPNGTKVVIVSGTKGIAEQAFLGCIGLTGITIPNSLTSIGKSAFWDCTGLTSITIPNGVTSIDSGAFVHCSGLTSVTICNKSCEIFDESGTFPTSAKIIGFSGSTAEAYAKKYSRTFEVHEHTIPSWTVVKAAACTESGSKQGICSVCKNKETQSIPALGHNYSWRMDKAATCTENGSKSQHCTRCGDRKDVTLIAATGHKFSSWKTEKKATCTKAGSKQRTCSVCKKTETQKLSALGHSYKIIKIKAKATLSKNGSAVAKCKRCGLTNSKTVIYKIKTVKLSASSFAYNGKAKTPTVTVKDSKGRTLKKNTDYTVKYSSGRKNIGTYTVTVTFKGNYSGQKSLKFKIVLGQVSGVAQMNKKGINFAWNKVAGASGYEVYNYDAPTKRYVKLAATKKTQLGNSGAKGKMKIKIRAFKKVGSKTYYGSFSKPVTFKAK